MQPLARRSVWSIFRFQLKRFSSGLEFQDAREMKSQGRGLYEKNCYRKWYPVNRWDYDNKTVIQVAWPAVKSRYNSFMGQTDDIGRLL